MKKDFDMYIWEHTPRLSVFVVKNKDEKKLHIIDINCHKTQTVLGAKDCQAIIPGYCSFDSLEDMKEKLVQLFDVGPDSYICEDSGQNEDGTCFYTAHVYDE